MMELSETRIRRNDTLTIIRVSDDYENAIDEKLASKLSNERSSHQSLVP